MKKKTLREDFEQKWKRARKGLKAYLRKGEAKALHVFRVQVKKIKALIRLAALAGHSGRMQRHFRPLRKLFRQTGILRDAQLLFQLSRSHRASPIMLARQQVAMKAAAQQLAATIAKLFPQIKKNSKKVRSDMKPPGQPAIDAFYRKTLENIAVALSGPKPAPKLHDCRK
ncbi:CHAD domain-containing protein [Taibaiella koreensis]|uniref:CHAD domain-containing protein n=1 Tax=Taibaiella koreensis TaxID=1268548 RepID=UPI000E59EBB3|nr:CHAD domain-containing protein [Taibaiella koreensis]